MKTIFLYAPDKGSASNYYRSALPMRHCRDALLAEGVELMWPEETDAKDDNGNPIMPDCDAYVFYRALKAEFLCVPVDLIARGKKVYWDLDDHIAAVPKWSPAYKWATDPKVIACLRICLTMAEGISVSTGPLAEVIQTQNPATKVEVLPNLVDVDDWPDRRPLDSDDPVQIVWAGGETHKEDLRVVVPALKAAREKHGNDIEIVFAGYCPDYIYNDPGISPLLIQGSPIQQYGRFLSYLRPDVCLAPLSLRPEDAPFNRCKSGIKYLEGAMSGAYMVASDIDPYQNVAGEKEILVSSESDWTRDLGDVVSGLVGSHFRHVPDIRNHVIDGHSWQAKHQKDKWLNYFRMIAKAA